MYGRTGNFSHFRARTGSHSTKGSARGIIWLVPNDTEPAAAEAEAPRPEDPRVEVSLQRMKGVAYHARQRLVAAHASGDAREMAKAKRHLKRVCGLTRGVKKFGASL